MNASMVPIFSAETLEWIEFNKLCYEQGVNVTNLAFQMWLYNIGELTKLQNELHHAYSQSK